MFDSVILVCPSCGGRIEFQSKAGTRDLSEYGAMAPYAIAADIDGDDEACEGCGKRYKAVSITPKLVQIQIVEL